MQKLDGGVKLGAVATSFRRGLQAWRAEAYFDAHEHWEDAWRASTDPAEQTALKGLIQLAASLYKHRRGQASGHAKLWGKARTHLESAAATLGVLHGIDLRAFVDGLSQRPSERTPDLERPRAVFGVVYLHGFGSSPRSPKARAIVGALEEAHVPVVAPCLADADDFHGFTVTRSLGRVRHALFERTLLVGSSLGGWTAALLACDDPRVVELVLLCPAFGLARRWSDDEDQLRRWRAAGELEFDVGHPPQPRALSVAFMDDALRHPGRVVPPVRTTVFHGRRDEIVPLVDVQSTVEGVPHVDLHVVDDDHGLQAHLPRIARLCCDRASSLV